MEPVSSDPVAQIPNAVLWVEESVLAVTINYQQLVEDSVHRLSGLMRQRRKLDAEIARLQKLVLTTARLSASTHKGGMGLNVATSNEPIGLTEAVRRVFATYRIRLTPVLVRDLLPSVGFDTSRYKEPLTSIHAILRRLVLRREVTREKAPDGGTVYVWVEASGDVQRKAMAEQKPETG